ncbi:MAG: chemotaxis protein CheX [Verrucomicrobiota bacterium]
MATAAQPISDTLVQESIIRAVRNVCVTMLKQETSFVEKNVATAYDGFKEKPHVFGSVGFAGVIAGIVYLCIPDDFAQEAAARVLDMSLAEVEMSGDEAVKDVVGEITNMTVGGFKNALCNVGFPCKLTLPTIVRGDNLAVASLKGASRHTFHFDCSGHRLIADIQLKQD